MPDELEPVLVLRVGGAVDADSALAVREQCEKVAGSLDTEAVVVLDLSGVQVVSADALVELATGLAASGIRIAFVGDPALDAALAGTPWRVYSSIDGALMRRRNSGAMFVALTDVLMRAESVGEVLQRIVDATVATVPSADMVSITLRGRENRLYTAASTADAAIELDELQYRFGEGPCHDTAVPGGPEFVECADLGAGDPWPRWSPEAVERGWRSVLATALMTTDESLVGALNLYSRSPDGLAHAEHDVVLLLATHASLAIAETDAVQRGESRQVQFHAALDSRDVIGQAKGIIMARRGCGPDEAFDLLRKTSQHLNVKLVDLATTLATRHGDLERSDEGSA